MRKPETSRIVLLIVLVTCAPGYGQNFSFIDATANLDSLNLKINEDSGPAWGDFNNDGLQDLYLGAFGVNGLYKNNGDGTFTNIAAQAGVDDSLKTKAATWGDIDNDGFLDLYLSNGRQTPNTLYLNNRDETFTEISAAAGMANMDFAQGGAWADFDEDGDLDYFLLQDDVGNNLFRNNGDLTFTDVAVDLNLANDWAAYGVSWFDYDNDGHLDLFVANCRNLNGPNWTNLLYRNGGDGTFSDVSAQSGVDYPGVSWGVEALDFDNDLDMDLLVVNDETQNSFLLYRNDNGFFTEISDSAGLDNAGRLLAVTQGDYDNDGDVDFFACGINGVYRLYENRGDGTFEDISEQVPFPSAVSSRFNGTATADYDNDGFLDFVAADEFSHAFLFKNTPGDSVASNHWLEINLKGVTNNAFGVGASIIVKSGGMQQMRTVTAGSGTYSQNMLTAHFGLGKAAIADSIIIHWPIQTTDILTGITADQMLTVTEGSTITHVNVASPRSPAAFTLHQNFPNPFNPSTRLSFSVRQTAPARLVIFNLAGQEIRAFQFAALPAGRHEVEWNGKDRHGRDVGSGIYLVQLRSGSFTRAIKIALVR